MKLLLKHVVVAAALTLSGLLNHLEDGCPSLAAASESDPERLNPDPRHEEHPPTHVGRHPHDHADGDHSPGRPRRERFAQPEDMPGPPHFDPPAHPHGARDAAGRPRASESFHRHYQKGDGSKPSHKYDYVIDELIELREELVDTEDTFGHDSDEAHVLEAKVRLKEQIRRNAKVRAENTHVGMMRRRSRRRRAAALSSAPDELLTVVVVAVCGR